MYLSPPTGSQWASKTSDASEQEPGEWDPLPVGEIADYLPRCNQPLYNRPGNAKVKVIDIPSVSSNPTKAPLAGLSSGG